MALAVCASISVASASQDAVPMDEGQRLNSIEEAGYAKNLALFQETPLNGSRTERETIRLLIAPFSRTHWLVQAQLTQNATVQFARLMVSEFDPCPDPKNCRNKGRITERLIRIYRSEIETDDFIEIRQALTDNRFHEKKLSGQHLVSEAPDTATICLDGTTYYIEAEYDDQRALISRHNCAEGFSSDIQLVSKMTNSAIENFPMLSKTLAKLIADIKGYERSTEASE